MCIQKSFDELVELFKIDPKAFEEYRQQTIRSHLEQLCNGCPDCLNRCQQFQWQLDQKLNKYKNPVARYNAMVAIFWKDLAKFQQTLRMENVPEVTRSATVLRFDKKG